MNTALMKNWSITNNQSGYTPTELIKYYLNGNIYNDGYGRFEDGFLATTSKILEVVDCEDHKVVITKATEYSVYPADVDEEYEKEYPDAFNRLNNKKVII